jgi:hypothetical protein
MGICFCHHEGSFLIWSSVVDAPIVYDCTVDDLREYVREKSGSDGLRGFDDSVERAVATGTSSRLDRSLEELVVGNHAGPDGEEIPYEDVIRFYFVEKRPPDHTATILDRARFD